MLGDSARLIKIACLQMAPPKVSRYRRVELIYKQFSLFTNVYDNFVHVEYIMYLHRPTWYLPVDGTRIITQKNEPI